MATLLIEHNAMAAASRSPSLPLTKALHQIPLPVVNSVLANGPSLAALHHQILRAADLIPDATRIWARRAKQAAALPRLQLGFRQSLKDNYDLSSKDSVSVTSGGVVIGPRTNDLLVQGDRRMYFDMSATWSLGELLFTNDSLKVSQEARHRREEIRALLHAATQLYAEYQRLRVILAAHPRTSTAPDGAVWRLQLAETVGQLDALTDGWFSRAIEGGTT